MCQGVFLIGAGMTNQLIDYLSMDFHCKSDY